MEKKTPDEILFEKIRNYCLDPWKSTRVDLPPYGVPVLMAWHHDRSSSDSEINGFAGYSFGVGARYYYEYEEKIEGDKVPVISSHLGEHLTSENFQAIDQCYNVGLYYDRPYSYNDYSNRRRTFGIRDPYLKPKSKTTKDGIKRYDYWVNFSEGKYGSCF